MVIIFCDIYRQICRIFVNFRLSCSNFDGHFKGQNFKTLSPGCVCKECRALNIEIVRKFEPKRARLKENLIS